MGITISILVRYFARRREQQALAQDDDNDDTASSALTDRLLPNAGQGRKHLQQLPPDVSYGRMKEFC